MEKERKNRGKRKYMRLKVRLNTEHKEELEKRVRCGIESVRVLKRAMVLLRMGSGSSSNIAADAIGVTPETARKIGWRYMEEGLESALYEKPRPGNPPLLNTKQKTRIIAMACTTPPEGFALWSCPLLAEHAIKKKIVDSVSPETIRVLLKSHDLKPWREKNVVRT